MTESLLLVVLGPTASGKTALSIELANCFHTEVLSFDSRQFFREMSIGTAKPTPAQLQAATHHFIHSHSIHQPYTVGQFEKEALIRLDSLFEKHQVVVAVGGSGLYLQAISEGFDELPAASTAVRTHLARLYEEKGLTALQQLLLERDPDYYHQVDLQNPQRLLRALEVCIETGVPFSGFRKGQQQKRNFRCIKIGLDLPRPILYERINRRVEEMMNEGLLEEVRGLLPFKQLNALQTVGYKELFAYLDGQTDLPSAIAAIQQNTRRFAKRQMTWFRRDPQIQWFSSPELAPIRSRITQLTGITSTC